MLKKPKPILPKTPATTHSEGAMKPTFMSLYVHLENIHDFLQVKIMTPKNSIQTQKQCLALLTYQIELRIRTLTQFVSANEVSCKTTLLDGLYKQARGQSVNHVCPHEINSIEFQKYKAELWDDPARSYPLHIWKAETEALIEDKLRYEELLPQDRSKPMEDIQAALQKAIARKAALLKKLNTFDYINFTLKWRPDSALQPQPAISTPHNITAVDQFLTASRASLAETEQFLKSFASSSPAANASTPFSPATPVYMAPAVAPESDKLIMQQQRPKAAPLSTGVMSSQPAFQFSQQLDLTSAVPLDKEYQIEMDPQDDFQEPDFALQFHSMMGFSNGMHFPAQSQPPSDQMFYDEQPQSGDLYTETSANKRFKSA